MIKALIITHIILFISAASVHAKEKSIFIDSTYNPIAELKKAYPIKGRMRVSYQNVKIGKNESMGLYGFQYDLFNGWKLFPGLFFSIGGYGAVTGDRGGFFTGGYGAGYSYEFLDIFSLEAGLFFGGGGGGAAPQGSGLMLQQYVAFQIDILGVGFQLMGSNINFPDGEIGSRQIAAGCVIPIERWVVYPASVEGEKIDGYNETGPFSVLISPLVYLPVGDSKLRDMTPLAGPVGLIGFGMEYYFRPKWFVKLSFFGAFYGGVDGYAQMLTGLGFVPFSIRNVDVAAMVQAGAGGGGAVHTGGGFLVKPSIGFRARLWRNYGIFLDAGYSYAPDGYFGAWSIETGLKREITPLSFDGSDAGKIIPDDVRSDYWKIVVLNKTFIPNKNVTLTTGAAMEKVIHLIGFSLSHPIVKNICWTGQAYGAWYGGIGGYAEGLLGIEVSLVPIRSWESFSISAGMLGGAAGGGGADVGSGIIWEVSGGVSYKISDISAVIIRGSFVDAVKGSFQGAAIRYGLSVDFGIPSAKTKYLH